MKFPKGFIALALLPLTLFGCSSASITGSSSQPTMEFITSSAGSTSASNSSESTNPSGNIAKNIGDEVKVSTTTGLNIYSFKVTSIDANFKCTQSYAQPPKNGNYIRVNLEVETADAQTLKAAQRIGVGFNGSSDWKYISANGTAFNGDISGSMFCLTHDQMFPLIIGSDEKASGAVILDVPASEGTLVYTDRVLDRSWEYKIP